MITRKAIFFLALASIIQASDDSEAPDNKKSSIRFTPSVIDSYREKVQKMFYHAYNGYLDHAFPLDELKPITCVGQDTWGSFSLSLIDALDTLLVMGNTTEFRRAVSLVLEKARDDANVNVSVFETNIRVVGGLISAHMLAGRHKDLVVDWEGYPCDSPLLKLAVKMADRLMPAFNTETGMPYGTVNLKYGVHKDETPITCTAGVGTFLIEFGTLSRLTGDDKYEKVALKALDALWSTRSPIGLVGNHINVQTGQWTATDSGIGAGVDSYFEYLAKGAYLFRRPSLMKQFHEHATSINKHVRKGEWFMWVSMAKGSVSLPIFQSLEAFWPGTLTMVGDVQDASRIMLTYSEVIRKYGFPPEFYNIHNEEPGEKRAAFPLRPEMVESLMYLYRATKDETWLELGAEMIDAIESSARTKCGYATINNVKEHSIEDRMESFFLAETTKYLYLLFDPTNFIHSKGDQARILTSPKNLTCVIYGGGYIFNTEAHPVDPGMLDCCSVQAKRDQEVGVKQVNNGDEHEKMNRTEKGGEKYFENQYGKNENLIEFEVDEKLKKESEKRKIELEAEKVKENSHKAMLKVREILVRAHQKDEAMQRNGETSDSARKLMDQLYKAYPNHTAELENLNKEAIIEFEELQHLEDIRELVREIPIPEVFCEKCCVPLHEIVDSVVLRVLMADVYEYHFYPTRKTKFLHGPVCWLEETPRIEDDYKNEPPSVNTEKWNSPLFTSDQASLNDFIGDDLETVRKFGFKTLLAPGYKKLDKLIAGQNIALRRKKSWYYEV
ncbi:alpha-1,2-Mannosidase [Caenorhabditis elegans]|uniref:alpha-1,2-Mannosidase n=1 Tax=Caenorhabditis elegans TaxID=6239 RepID=P90830_CAEEL|nr:alpha-1,2-Mannosidase [Caenorhabditis elegans]CAB04078.1 alpha-1,2-Mannosidase [Caenorhabditis elegans]|eukprot:NP_506018.1 alpha-1,2-Mannosidase [Caenorhabditis elegans]